MAFMTAVNDLLWTAFVVERSYAVASQPVRRWLTRYPQVKQRLASSQNLLDLVVAMLCVQLLHLPPPLEGLIDLQQPWVTWLISSCALAGCIPLWRALWERLLGIHVAAATPAKPMGMGMSLDADDNTTTHASEPKQATPFRLGALSLNRSTS